MGRQKDVFYGKDRRFKEAHCPAAQVLPVVVTPYYIYTHENLKVELTHFSTALTHRRYFESGVIEILPLPGRTGHELTEIITNY